MERVALDAGATVTMGSAGRWGGGRDADRHDTHDSVRGHDKGSHIGAEATTRAEVRQTDRRSSAAVTCVAGGPAVRAVPARSAGSARSRRTGGPSTAGRGTGPSGSPPGAPSRPRDRPRRRPTARTRRAARRPRSGGRGPGRAAPRRGRRSVRRGRPRPRSRSRPACRPARGRASRDAIRCAGTDGRPDGRRRAARDRCASIASTSIWWPWPPGGPATISSKAIGADPGRQLAERLRPSRQAGQAEQRHPRDHALAGVHRVRDRLGAVRRDRADHRAIGRARPGPAARGPGPTPWNSGRTNSIERYQRCSRTVAAAKPIDPVAPTRPGASRR